MMVQAAQAKTDTEDGPVPRRIHVSKLQVGMTVLREREDGKLVTDCHLAKKFTNSSPRMTLAFVTSAKQNVVWQNCGYVWIL